MLCGNVRTDRFLSRGELCVFWLFAACPRQSFMRIGCSFTAVKLFERTAAQIKIVQFAYRSWGGSSL